MSNESLPLFLPNPNREVLTIGIVYSTLAACAIPIYVPVLYVMFTDKDITSNPQYRLMNQINIADFGQVIFHMLSGIYIIFPQIQVQYQVLVRISGCTTNSLWLAMFPIMSVLSITRILVIREIISPKYTHTGLKILMVFGWLYTIGVWLWGCITQNFILAGVGWTYDLTKLGAETLAALEWYLCFPSLGITYIAYVVIVLHVHATRRRAMNSTTNRQEVKIFLQSTFLCVYMVTLITMWHNAEIWFEMTNVTIAILNSAWICFSYLNPLLLLALNKTIRVKVLRVVGGKVGQVSIHNLSVASKQTRQKTNTLSQT
ncbi:hypothetical protein Y032_0006g2829 [Ancylostoma ceylanicum]|uniref:G-protein coupled receptors family 1 profile domain-containing protein n=1 Tax=Ancylostoma ceylanicum TaxID=53326 RepID=A0A016VP45_9BILA|nr:hypothetical protein Y032_0006g2829 [Ancylostoma ceylanicum]